MEEQETFPFPTILQHKRGGGEEYPAPEKSGAASPLLLRHSPRRENFISTMTIPARGGLGRLSGFWEKRGGGGGLSFSRREGGGEL